VLESYNDDHAKGLIMRGIKNNKGPGSGDRSKSKSNFREIKCFECHEVGYFRKNCLK
jgi:hypothetical protein